MAKIECLGQFEQLVLTAVLALDDNAYGVTITRKLKSSLTEAGAARPSGYA